MPGARPASKVNTPSAGGGGGLEGYAYVEVMACPGGCTNGGGQIKVDDLPAQTRRPGSQKEWLGLVDEAYFSMPESDGSADGEEGDVVMSDVHDGFNEHGHRINGISPGYIKNILEHWVHVTGVPLDKLVRTSYREVESDVGKAGAAESEKVVELAGKIGGGW